MAKEIVSRKLAKMRRTMYGGAPLDPETLWYAAQYGLHHFEAGTRKFVDFSKEMLNVR